jgi:hypothetical protein
MNRGRTVATTRVVWCLALAGVVSLAIACSSGDLVANGNAVPLTTTRAEGARERARARATTTTTSPPTTTTTTTLIVVPGVDPTLEKTVWDAYLAALDSIDYAATDPAKLAGVIDMHLTNAMLTTWQARLAQFVQDDESAHYPQVSTHGSRLYGVTVKNPNWVDLDACTYDDAIVSVTGTGAVVDDSRSYLKSTETMWLEDGTWRLAGRDGEKVDRSKCPGF